MKSKYIHLFSLHSKLFFIDTPKVKNRYFLKIYFCFTVPVVFLNPAPVVTWRVSVALKEKKYYYR